MIDNNFDFNDIFEEKLCHYTGFRYAVTVDCCTNAILLSIIAKMYNGEIELNDALVIPCNTYMSVPMTLSNNGFTIEFSEEKWKGFYEIGPNTEVFDAATDLHENMVNDYKDKTHPLVCVSFQQKKRLSLGRGGVILFNDEKYLELLKRLRHDGRNQKISDKEEIRNNPNDIICGYHCYMEPDKAMVGILKLNQKNLLPSYVKHSYEDYEDLRKLKIFQK